MRRVRHIVGATLLMVICFYIFSEHQDELSESYGTSILDEKVIPLAESKGPGPALGDEKVSDDVAHTEVIPLSDLPQSEISSQDNLVPEGAISLNDPSKDDPQMDLTALDDIPPSVEFGDAPSGNLQVPPSPANTPPFEAEFIFQQDLELDLPVELLRELSSHAPRNYRPGVFGTNAYATFMATRNPSVKDPYFLAIHSLVYRVLWSPRSRTEKHPFVVFVGDFVTQEQRELLSGAGALVRELAPLEWTPKVEGVQRRWKDLFAKLNMWKETDFSRILFLDADAFPVANIDSMFDAAQSQDCIESRLQPDDALVDGTQVCEPYVFAGVPQDPFNETDVNINVGGMVFAPSERMHQRLIQNYVKTDNYNSLMAEQAFLNWQFNQNGAFPAGILEREYNGFFPQENEEGQFKVVHEKLWTEERSWMKEEWHTQWQEMLSFYSSEEFLAQRKSQEMQ
ncbi:nucleotide-diphospho-sugar transferase [Corynespora cassiicola Philippines]|uniref:Nucleotide-diphospho-sugar transferase n=1 Tax=Corynespora cassiicola Philippines TaxID=1448308 RepID=A0A2T2P3S2_CORCC|nr:nucleotide-diphospho-sugar transferase [Corynespora cassiicola Philippines]